MQNSKLGFEVLESRDLLSVAPLLVDNFDGSYVNSANWKIPTWVNDHDGTFLGRTQLACSQNYSGPAVSNGAVHMTLDTFNPTGFSLYGTELIGLQEFKPTTDGVDIKFVAKLDSSASRGAVGGLFLYNVDPNNPNSHDEIDFELLGNWAYDGTNRVNTNVYANEPHGVGTPVGYVLPNNGKVTDYHTYEIKWEGTSVSWLVDQVLLRTETSKVPAGSMKAYINFWGPGAEWADAYYSGFQPVANSNQNTRLTMDVSSVEIDVPFSITSASVNIANKSVVQNGRVNASGTILGTGNGSIQYEWMAQLPDGSSQKVGTTLSTTMVNGVAVVPNFTLLPAATAGDYKAWIRVLSTDGSIDSNLDNYSSFAFSRLTVSNATISANKNAVVKGTGIVATAKILGTGTGSLKYYWMVKEPAGVFHKVGKTLSVIMTNGVAVTPKFSLLPVSRYGNYQARLVVTAPGKTLSGKIFNYKVVFPPPRVTITSVPKLGQMGYANGKVTGDLSKLAGVAVYICVNGGWWNKPYWDQLISTIDINGNWSANITTGGFDQNATAIRAYLIPKGLAYRVVHCSGDSVISGMEAFVFNQVNRK